MSFLIAKRRQAQAAARRLPHLLRHPVTHNAGALLGVTAARYLIPLALVPFLARILHPAAFGQLAIAQSLGQTLAFLAEFGFSLTATRAFARHRDQPHSFPGIAASVVGAKLLLAGVIGGIGLILAHTVPAFAHHPEFLWGACLLAVAVPASPVWFFQGIETMVAQSAIDVGGSALGAALVFIFIRRPDQAVLVLYLVSAGALGGAAVNYGRMYRRIGFVLPRWRPCIQIMRESIAMVVMKGSIVLYTSINSFLLGLFVSAAAVADFAGAEKIVRAATSVLLPVNQALFPRIAHLMTHNRARALRLLAPILALFSGAGLLGTAILVWAAPWIIHLLLGPGYEAAVPLLRWLAVLVLLLAVNYVLGSQVLLPLGKDWAVAAVGAGAAACNITTMFLLVPRFGALGMAWSTTASEALAVAALAGVVWRSGVFSRSRRAAAAAAK